MLDPIDPFQIKPPLRGYDALFNQILSKIPAGDFYDTNLGYPIVPWSRKPNIFTMETNIPGTPIKISLQRLGPYHPGVDEGNLIQDFFFVPTGTVSSFKITLGLGLNRITATELTPNGRIVLLDVMATPNAMLFEAMGREIFKSVDLLEQQQAAIYSPYATRLPDQVIQFQGLLPTVQSLKILSTKLLVRASIHFPATTIGTQDMIQAFALNTPIFEPMRNSSVVHLERSRTQRAQQNQAGQEAHVWFPNGAVTRWLAFTRMADSFRTHYILDSLRDDFVRYAYKGKDLYLDFNYDAVGENFLSNLSLTDCFDNIDMSLTTLINSRYFVPLWTYTFDLLIPPTYPLGLDRPPLDTGVVLDSGYRFDADPIDPWNDGWVGWSLSNRFDGNRGLDSAVEVALAPSPPWINSPTVYYPGPCMQMFNTHLKEIEFGYSVTASGTLDIAYVPGPIVKLDLDLPLATPVLQAGTSYPILTKFADSMSQTVPTGLGAITIQESNGGTSQIETVIAGGYVLGTLIPTKAGQTYWDLTSGLLTGQSETRTVTAGPFAALAISAPIPNQAVGVPFSVSVQALDIYGNIVTDVGPNKKLVIKAEPGFPVTSITPTHVMLIDGAATVSITCSVAGTGALLFELNAVSVLSNTFTVT